MGNKLGMCGLNCLECPAYIATLNDNDELRTKAAKKWSKLYNSEISSEDINCKGCFNNEVLFSHCNECEIRECAKDKGVSNCGRCEDYPCERIEEFMKFVPEVRDVLDRENKK